ncbi:formylglycine-generating enzyme family protein [Desertivirga xinjiangensis]|uniref:formylglycine-generating enzyme family protein n=1 Tax=Desertivirga xinjiangensis TaxID=539206 RepID=UPI00210E522D|nr:formylglycine-generating enzyme family protein [Pedobacter xinjiangensis]
MENKFLTQRAGRFFTDKHRICLFISVLLCEFSVSSVATMKSFAQGGMVKIPTGTYKGFYENSQAEKIRVKTFYMDVHAVTNAQYLEFVKANPIWSRSKVSRLYADAGYLKHWESDFKISRDKKMDNSPVVNVSWFAASAYCKWKGKRLPGLEEWEYAAKAKPDHSDIDKIILNWYSKPNPVTLPNVGSAPSNSYKLQDMHGLIWEWVYDFNSVMLEGDSRSNAELNRNMFCAAGSAGVSDRKNYAAFMRFAFRSSLKANYTVNNLGFRCSKNVE